MTIVTDNKPLLGILSEEKGIPKLQWWAIILSGYNYTLKYKTGTSNSNADCLSQFPKDCENDFSKLDNLVFLTDLAESPVTSLDIKNESAKDPIISRVIHYVQFGWAMEKTLSLAFDPYKNHNVELNEKLNTFLFTYKITPQSTIGISPAELLINRKLNSKCNIIKPRAELINNIFLPNVARQFKKGDEVWIQNFRNGDKWILGTILCCTCPISYKTLTEKGIVKKRRILAKKETAIKDEIYPEVQLEKQDTKMKLLLIPLLQQKSITKYQ